MSLSGHPLSVNGPKNYVLLNCRCTEQLFYSKKPNAYNLTIVLNLKNEKLVSGQLLNVFSIS